MDFCQGKKQGSFTLTKKALSKKGFCLFVYFCLHLFGYITAMRKEVVKYGSSTYAGYIKKHGKERLKRNTLKKSEK